VDFDVM
jgi:hypothetical protein